MTDPCDLVTYPLGGPGVWDADTLVSIVLDVAPSGDVAPYVTTQALLDGDSVFFQQYQGEAQEPLVVRAEPNVAADVLYVTSGWPGGRTCGQVFEREAAPRPPFVDTTQAEYPPTAPPATPQPTAQPVTPGLAQTGPTVDPSLVVALAMMLVVVGLVLLWLGRKERRQEHTALSENTRGDNDAQ